MEELKSKIESLLFISNKPLSAINIEKFIKVDLEKIEKALDTLFHEYKNRDGGIVIAENLKQYQMVTNAINSEVVKDFTRSEVTGELTQPALETLTIVAYRGPISKPELEEIRGVNCSLIIRNLIIRGLITAEKGRVFKEKDDFGDKVLLNDEMYYNITFDFLKFLGVKSVSELPDYEKLNLDNIADIIAHKNNQ